MVSWECVQGVSWVVVVVCDGWHIDQVHIEVVWHETSVVVVSAVHLEVVVSSMHLVVVVSSVHLVVVWVVGGVDMSPELTSVA